MSAGRTPRQPSSGSMSCYMSSGCRSSLRSDEAPVGRAQQWQLLCKRHRGLATSCVHQSKPQVQKVEGVQKAAKLLQHQTQLHMVWPCLLSLMQTTGERRLVFVANASGPEHRLDQHGCLRPGLLYAQPVSSQLAAYTGKEVSFWLI